MVFQKLGAIIPVLHLGRSHPLDYFPVNPHTMVRSSQTLFFLFAFEVAVSPCADTTNYFILL